MNLTTHLAATADPQYKQLLEQKVTVTELTEKAFAKRKADLCYGVAVKLPNQNKTFVVETDFSVHDF